MNVDPLSKAFFYLCPTTDLIFLPKKRKEKKSNFTQNRSDSFQNLNFFTNNISDFS